MTCCLECGELSDEARCEQHRASPVERRGSSPRERGYDAAWDRLSRSARAAQPWCSDCGATSRLTADHKPSAWRRKAKGLPLRLIDLAVVCSDCNWARGSSRPGSPRADPGR